MSRARLVYALAFFGILITTGGCGSSATAPEAAIDGAAFSAKKAPSDSTVSDDGVTTMGGVFLPGGGRSAP